MASTTYSPAGVVFRAVLKEMRSNAGLTQTELAEKLGRPQSYVSKFESGERRLDFVETAQICDVLGIGIDEFAIRFKRKLGRWRTRKQRV